jgi:hypothetical protein
VSGGQGAGWRSDKSGVAFRVQKIASEKCLQQLAIARPLILDSLAKLIGIDADGDGALFFPIDRDQA